MNPTASVEAAHQSIHDHSFVQESGLIIPPRLVSEKTFSGMKEFEQDVLMHHMNTGVDLLVGDDVSGRIPTLITHRFLRLALAGGHIEYVPRTMFMASGLIRHDRYSGLGTKEVERQWSNNLSEHATKVMGEFPVKKVLVLTEIIDTGSSVKRLEKALNKKGVKVKHMASPDGGRFHLGRNVMTATDRQIVGVEKTPPAPIAKIHPKFNAKKASQLRAFLDDYTAAIYTAVFGDLPHPNHLTLANRSRTDYRAKGPSRWRLSRNR